VQEKADRANRAEPGDRLLGLGFSNVGPTILQQFAYGSSTGDPPLHQGRSRSRCRLKALQVGHYSVWRTALKVAS